MGQTSVEIICSACGAEALLIRSPRYDGFTKVGEIYACSACGHEYATEEDVPYKRQEAERVFTEADRSEAIEVFEEHEAQQLCRHCQNYVVNPFMQWCASRKKEVEATDTCDAFSLRIEVEEEDDHVV